MSDIRSAETKVHKCEACGRFMRKLDDGGWRCVLLIWDNYVSAWEHL